MKNVIIVDLDGTLCNSSHRDHHAQAKEWDEFHSKLGLDAPHKDVVQVINIMQEAGYKAYGLTGRSERWRKATNDWLFDHRIDLNALMMRPDHNFDPDHELKPAMLRSLFGSFDIAQQRVLMILEDRDKVVEAWRNLGFRCWQVQPGGY